MIDLVRRPEDMHVHYRLVVNRSRFEPVQCHIIYRKTISAPALHTINILLQNAMGKQLETSLSMVRLHPFLKQIRQMEEEHKLSFPDGLRI